MRRNRRQEAFDAACSMHDQTIFFTQFIHTQNRDDVLEFSVALQRGLNASSDRVVSISHVLSVQNSAGRRQGIDGLAHRDLDGSADK